MKIVLMPLALCLLVAISFEHGDAQPGEALASIVSPRSASVTPTTLDFTGSAVSPSQWKMLTYYYSGPGQGYMVITASAHAQVSLQGTTFSQSVSFSIAPPIMPPVTIYVRVISADTTAFHDYVWCTANAAGIPYLGVPPAVFRDTVSIAGSFLTTGVAPAPDVPVRFTLEQNYPNPFNLSTRIRYEIPVAAYTTLDVYDVLGKKVASLVGEVMQPGSHTITWNAAGCSSGMYICSLRSGDKTGRMRLVLLK